MQLEAAGEPMRQGKMDPNAGPGLALTPEQASTHTWKPDPETWQEIKRLSAKSTANITILGFADDSSKVPVSVGKVTIATSSDPVSAPIFYRDVPLLLPQRRKKGPIAPLPRSAIPLIKWQIRDISQPESHSGDDQPADLRELPFVLARWQDFRTRSRRPPQ